MSRMARRQALARRRARIALVGACLFAAVVLATSLPLRTWMDQRAAVATTAATVRRLAREDHELAAQAAMLAKPSTIRALAHSQFGYVEPGQKAYVVVPSASSGSTSPPSSADSGVGPSRLSEPVAVPGSPSSAEVLGNGPLSAGGSTSSSGRSARVGSSAARSDRQAGPGFWSRVVHSLEFWE